MAMARGASRHGETNGSISPQPSGRGRPWSLLRSAPEPPMEAFLVSISTVGIAEIGDRTQLLSLVLACRYRQPLPITAGILVATLANHSVAAFLGRWIGGTLTPAILDGAVGLSMLAMGLWTLRPDKLDEESPGVKRGAFMATTIAFFIA